MRVPLHHGPRLKRSSSLLSSHLHLHLHPHLHTVTSFPLVQVELHVTFARDMATRREKLAAVNPPPPGSHIAEAAGASSAKSQAEYVTHHPYSTRVLPLSSHHLLPSSYFAQSFAAITVVEQECRSLLQAARRADAEGGGRGPANQRAWVIETDFRFTRCLQRAGTTHAGLHSAQVPSHPSPNTTMNP